MTNQPSKKLAGLADKPIILLIAVIIAGGFFLYSGYDPLGLFGPNNNQPVYPVQPPVDRANWWQVLFTDPVNLNDSDALAGSVAEQLIVQIDEAQTSIHIAAFEFNLTPVAEALIAAHQRGVEVLWVTDDEHGLDADTDEGHGQFAMLKEAGISIKDDGRTGLMHNKFWVFDRQGVWTGSTNITRNGIFRNNNNVIFLDVPEVAEIYEREFDEMWGGEFGPRSPSTVESQQVTISGTPVQVLFGAEDEVIEHLVPVLAGAEREIRFMAFAFTNNELGNTLLREAVAGTEVKGIFETRASETEFSELSYLFCAGVTIHQDGNPGVMHHKVIIIDEETVITGSLNFSDNADSANDENVLVITHADIAAYYLQEFERRWAESVEPDQAEIECR